MQEDFVPMAEPITLSSDEYTIETEQQQLGRAIKTNPGEMQYLNLLQLVAAKGVSKSDRTEVGTRSMFGAALAFDLQVGFPLLTTKKVHFKSVLEELLFFVSGETNTKILEDKGVNIWKGNTTREFLDMRGLTNYAEGEYGPAYGFQWRNWGGDYQKFTKDGTKTGIDQLTDVIQQLKENPHSRRHVVSAWNPSQISQMALPPCHAMFQFWVDGDGGLHTMVYQRSCDLFLGVPFNIASYAALTHIVAKLTGLTPSVLQWVGGDVHVYNNHLTQVREQVSRARNIRQFPELVVSDDLTDLDNITSDMFELVGYDPHPAIKAPMAV